MKRIAGLAAALVVVAAACSDSPTSPRENPLVAKPMSPGAKAALARSMGIDPTTTFSNNRQYLQNGNQANLATPQFWISAFGTNLNFGDDECAFVAFNFQFTFFGQAATGVWVSSNGNVRFGSPLEEPSNCESYTPTTLPSGADRIIAPLFFDLVGEEGANNVYFRVVGQAPNRRFVVTWLNMPAFSFGGSYTYQLQLLERLNVILFLYNGLNPPRAFNWTGTPLTAGIASGQGAGFGGFPGFLITATGTQALTLDGQSFCLINLGGAYRVYQNLICSLFVF